MTAKLGMGFVEWVGTAILNRSYGSYYSEIMTRAAHLIDKILKGAQPADLPMEQPTKFEPAINLKTAKALLGLAVPPSLLARADEMIE
jgi:putative ABC transport system substrate-binding protein